MGSSTGVNPFLSENDKTDIPMFKTTYEFRKYFKKEVQNGNRKISFISLIPDYEVEQLLNLVEGIVVMCFRELNAIEYEYTISVDGDLVTITIKRYLAAFL